MGIDQQQQVRCRSPVGGQFSPCLRPLRQPRRPPPAHQMVMRSSPWVHHVCNQSDPQYIQDAYASMDRAAAVGADGETWLVYNPGA